MVCTLCIVFPQASPSGIHITTLRVQSPYTLETHGTAITYIHTCINPSVHTHIHTCIHTNIYTYNSYIPQTEQYEPEERMLFYLGNVTNLLDVTLSNTLPYPLSPPPIQFVLDLVAKQYLTNIHTHMHTYTPTYKHTHMHAKAFDRVLQLLEVCYIRDHW